jgi:histidine triad (HIT) family protein
VQGMNAEQLGQFLMQNDLIKTDSSSQIPQASPQCIFCSIVSGQAQSYKIDENKDSIAILEINPISKAHSLIIPKQHISESEKIPQTAFTLSKKIAKKIKTKFKPKDVLISSSNFMGHVIINILPIYKDETLDSQRHRANPKNLEKLQRQLEKKSKPKTAKKLETKKEKIRLPNRIP